jgi:hypothetical protein
LQTHSVPAANKFNRASPTGRVLHPVLLLLQLVPAVTELMVAELLYLEKQGQSLPIEMLINSSGTTRQDGEIVSIHTYARDKLICDCSNSMPLPRHQMQQRGMQLQQQYQAPQQLTGITWAAGTWAVGHVSIKAAAEVQAVAVCGACRSGIRCS